MLFFDDEALFSGYFDLLGARLREYEFENDLDIKLYSEDEVSNATSQFPAVSFDLFGHSTNQNATDFEEIEYVSRFSVQIDVYTSGLDKAKVGLNLANEIVRFFQEKRLVSNFYTRGLSVVSKNRTPSLNDNICRYTVMLSGKCDNRTKLILPR